MKKVWSGIKSIISIKKCKNSSIPNLFVNNKTIDNPADIANSFNKFFVNVGKITEQSIPMSNRSPLCYLDGDYPHSFLLTPVSVSEVSTIISGLNSSKSVAPNSILITLLKILNNELSEILSKLVSDSFESGIFPDKLKIARVAPVFKKGSRSNRDDYRPISVLSIFSKIYKKLMYKRLYNYLEKYDILYSLQFGFREKVSTSQALMSISEIIRKSIDNKEYGCSVFIDLTKAFDTVHHSILLSKLNHYGIRGIAGDWFRSFITNRKQFVTVNGSNSDLLPITCGVPQG